MKGEYDMKCFVIIILALTLLLTLTACAADSDMPEPPLQEEQPQEQPLEISLPAPEPFPGKIVIITNSAPPYEEENYSAQEVVAKYGEDKIVHEICWYDHLAHNKEPMENLLSQLASDADIKAVIIDHGIPGTLLALDKLWKIRDDIFIVLCEPLEDPADVTQRASLILKTDELAMGTAIAEQAYKMGAKTFVNYFMRRGQSYPLIPTRYEMISEQCEKLDIEVVYVAAANATNDISADDMQRSVMEEVLILVEKYGADTAFFCTNCVLQAPLIKAVVDSGAIYPQPCCPSPLHGFPLALGLVSEDENVLDKLGSVDSVINETTHMLAQKGMLGRVSTWPAPTTMLMIHTGVEYAIKWINGEVPKEGIDVAALKQCMEDYAGVECFARTYVAGVTNFLYGNEPGTEYPNCLLLRQDYLTYGK